jgi:hypothetical protein
MWSAHLAQSWLGSKWRKVQPKRPGRNIAFRASYCVIREEETENRNNNDSPYKLAAKYTHPSEKLPKQQGGRNAVGLSLPIPALVKKHACPVCRTYDLHLRLHRYTYGRVWWRHHNILNHKTDLFKIDIFRKLMNWHWCPLSRVFY